ncbi:MAG: hypothetical protein Q8867_07835 [Bacteroidota bacterium]|nr:hypothetical protein [Bacteroidota bacterium]
MAYFTPEKVAYFAPELLAYFTPEKVAGLVRNSHLGDKTPGQMMDETNVKMSNFEWPEK